MKIYLLYTDKKHYKKVTKNKRQITENNCKQLMKKIYKYEIREIKSNKQFYKNFRNLITNF